jgi:DNA polymerase-3 subunit beta
MTITTPIETQQIIRVGTATLVAAVKDALRAVPKKAHTPLMTQLLLRAEGGVLSITGYDYELSVTRIVGVDGIAFDPVLLAGKTLCDALTRLDQKQPVEVVSTGTKVTLRQGTRVVTLNTHAKVEEYPQTPVVVGAVFETIGTTLSTFAATLATCVGKDDMLPALTGYHLSLEGNELAGATTDRFRLAHIHRPVAGLVDTFEALVPNLPAIAAVMANSVSITVHWDPTLRIIAFSSEEAYVTQRVLDGDFPKVLRLFPTEPNTTTTFEPVQFLSALKFVEAGCERNTAVGFTVTKESGIVLDASDGDGNTHGDTVSAEVDGEDLATGFNPAFLADAVKVFGKGHNVVMSSTSGTKPSVFESESIPNLRILVMPRRMVS